MKEIKRELRLHCDGQVVLKGQVDKLAGKKRGWVKSYQFPCNSTVQLDIVTYTKVQKKKR